MTPTHTCIKDDGGTPNRVCDACIQEKQDLYENAVKNAEVALRQAAFTFAHWKPSRYDWVGAKCNRALLRYARKYAEKAAALKEIAR